MGMNLKQAAEYQRRSKKMSYKDQVDLEKRMTLLRNIERRQWQEQHPREEPRKKKLFGFW